MKYTNLQAGRFLAAAAVLVFHAAYYAHDQLGLTNSLIDPVPAYLFRTAVIFFFALSGFVLAHGLQRASLGHFLLSRLFRLYPAYWVAAATVLLVRELEGNQLPFDRKGLWHAFLLWPAGPHRSAYSLGVEWTLVYELFLSIALIPFAALGRRWGLGVGSAIWLILIIGHQIATGGTVFHQFPKPSELPLSAMNAAFLLGVLGYFSLAILSRYARFLPVLAIASLAGGALCLSKGIAWSLLLQSLGTAAMVTYCACNRQLAKTNRLVRAGDWSYGIYLVHVPVMTAVFALAVRQNWLSSPFSVAAFGSTMALAVGAAYGACEWAIYRRIRDRLRRPKNAVSTHDEPVASPREVPSVPLRRAA